MRSFSRPVFVTTLLVFIATVNSQSFDGSFDTTCGNSSTLGNVLSYGRYCSFILGQWYNTIDPELYFRATDDTLQFQNNSQQWEEICRWSASIAGCYESLLPDCNPGIGLELMNSPKFFPRVNYFLYQLFGFNRKTCSGRTLKTDIRNRIEDPTVDVNTSCLITSPLQDELIRCTSSLKISVDKNFRAKLRAGNAVVEPAVNCMFSAINRSPCNTATKRMLYHVAILQLPSFIDEGELSLDESTAIDFSSHLRCTVGVYGDPHLKMCFEPGLTTCSAVGPQTLIANSWFHVAGEHQYIVPGNPSATSLRSIQLIFYSLDSAQLVATYTANGGSLPATFDGGVNSTVAGQGNDEVTVTTDGYLVEFVQQSTGMILKLRQRSGNYFFTLRVAQGVIKKSYGLLVSGCPANQIISRSTWLSFGTLTKESCETACNSTIADETFRDTCVFYCFATEDVEFGVNMTSSAEVDVVEIEKRDEEIRARAETVTEKPSNLNTASSTIPTLSKGNTDSSTLPTPVNSQPDGSFDTTCGNSSTLGSVFRYDAYCFGILSQWYNNEFDFDLYSTIPNYPVQFQNNSQQWEEICRWSLNMARCYESVLPYCSPGIGVELLNNPKFFLLNSRKFLDFQFYTSSRLLAFYRRTCSGKTLKTDIQNRIEDPAVNVNTSCLITSQLQEEFTRCTRSLDVNTYRNYNDTLQAINAAAEPAVNCMFSAINRSPCNTATKRMLYHVARLQLPSFVDESELSLDESTTMDFSSHRRCTIGVYGDPHLKMCFEPGLTTCSAVGPQTLVANGWFSVTGEHQSIGRPGNPPATSLRSFQLIFYSLASTQLVATYTADVGSLPATFDGDVNSTVAGEENDEVTITNDGYLVEFVQQSTGMILKLRQWSGNYFFTLRVAQGVIKKSYGLLVSGCPANQIISRSNWRWFSLDRRRKRAVTQESCETACNSTFADETYRDTCAFDCFATDDVEFGLNMTSSAEVDVVEIVTRDEQIRARAVNVTEKVDEEFYLILNTASSTLPTNTLIVSSICYVIVWFIHTRNMVIT